MINPGLSNPLAGKLDIIHLAALGLADGRRLRSLSVHLFVSRAVCVDKFLSFGELLDELHLLKTVFNKV